MPKEGKTSTAVNMAVAFSQLKEKVLIVDADLRRPRMHRIFKLKNTAGLSGYLTGKVNIEEAVHKSDINNIWVMPSGPIPPNPSELLNSGKMQRMLDELKKGFDVIILDTPPVMAVVDPVITASIVEATILVVQSGQTKDKVLIDAAEELRRGKAKILGAVLNRVKLDKTGYYSSRYYKSPYRYRNYEE
jgi:capsular exopolysaccharide synthesis family protein